MMPSRRDVLKALAGGPLLFAPQRPAAVTTVNGVVFGVETFGCARSGAIAPGSTIATWFRATCESGDRATEV
jgi:hypothetical protein